MAYIDLTYYKTTYSGFDPGDDTEITKAINRAADLIDIQTGFEISSLTLATWQDDLVKKTNAAQAEYYLLNGEGFSEESKKSESIGKYSYSGGEASGKDKLCTRAKSFLSQSNLMNRSVMPYPNDFYQEADLANQ